MNERRVMDVRGDASARSLDIGEGNHLLRHSIAESGGRAELSSATPVTGKYMLLVTDETSLQAKLLTAASTVFVIYNKSLSVTANRPLFVTDNKTLPLTARLVTTPFPSPRAGSILTARE